MHWSTWAIPLTIGVAWACFRMWRTAGPPVAQIANDDPAMIEAIAKARATIPDFVRALQAPAGGSRDFSIKADFPDLQEHMWVTDLQYADGVFTGALGNAPRRSTTLKLGDEVRVPETLISDWKYIENDVLSGGYSLRLIRSRMTDKARKNFDSRLDFTFAVILLTLVGVFAASRLAGAQTNGPEQAARDFLYALYANDAADFQRRIVPEPNSELMVGRQTFTSEQLEKLKKEIGGLPLHLASPVSADGTKAIYFTQLRGVVMAIPMQRSESGWRVDVRFWLAMMKQSTARPQKSDPEMVAKGFLFHILAKKPGMLNEFTSQRINGDEYTAANNLPAGDLDQILSLCVEMPIVRARLGERVVLPSGESAVGADGGDSLVLIGLMGSTEIPFLLRRVGEEWKVVPQKYFEMLRGAGGI